MAHLSKVNVRNKNNGKMGKMYNAREHMNNLLCYADFASLCQVINYFTQLNLYFGKKDINFPLSSSSTAIERRKNLNEFELGLSIIDATMYHDFTIDEKYFCGNCIYTIGQ